MAAGTPRCRRRVTTIAGLGQRVGAEADADVGGDDLVDHCAVCPRVEVVDELAALVTKKSCVFESRRPFHSANASRLHPPRRRNPVTSFSHSAFTDFPRAPNFPTGVA